MGGVIRRLASKCACNVVKEKASDFLVHFSLVWLVLEDQERSFTISENSIGVTLIMLSLKSIGRMLSILYLVMLYFSSVSCTSRDLPMDLLVLLTTHKTLASC